LVQFDASENEHGEKQPGLVAIEAPTATATTITGIPTKYNEAG